MSIYSDSQTSLADGLSAGSTRSSVSTDPEGGQPVPSNAGSGEGVELFTLVIGGLGFIGSHTSLALLKAGYNVIIVDNLSNSFEHVFTRIKHLAAQHYLGTGRDMPELYLHKIDHQSQAMRCLLDAYSTAGGKGRDSPQKVGQVQTKRQVRIAGVIHFAAFKSVAESIRHPISYYQNNICSLVGLMELLSAYSIHNFIFSSSATVYGSKADQGRLLREEDVIHHPLEYTEVGKRITVQPSVSGLQSPYARTKYFGEAILADIAHSNPAWRIVCLRYFNPVGCDASGLLGEDPRGVPTNLFPVISRVLTGVSPTLSIFGSDWDTRDGTPLRDFVHVNDVASGHVAALSCKSDVPFRTYNLGSGTGTTVSEVVRSFEAAAGRPIPVRHVGRRAGDVGSCVASNELARRELGWYAQECITTSAMDLWRYVSRAGLLSKAGLDDAR